MLEICISGYLVVSVTVSILLWQALALAKRADYGQDRVSNPYHFEPGEGDFPLVSTIASGND